MNIFRRMWRAIRHMIFGAESIEKALGVSILIDHDLELDRQLWQSMIDGKAPWNIGTDGVPSLRLASGIRKEAARYTVFEVKTKVEGSPRADYLNEQYQRVINNGIEDVKVLTGLGALIFKPYARGDKILVNTVNPCCFYPLKMNEIDQITSVVFAETLQKEETYYTLFETHEWNETTKDYIIQYDAFYSLEAGEIGRPIGLSRVEEWANLQPSNLYQNIPQPLFVECNMSEMKSIFAEAVDIIREADEQLGRTIWEYAGGELAIDASIDLFRKDANGEWILPKNKRRLFRGVDVSQASDFSMNVFSPPYREVSLFRGLNEYKRTIEFIIGYAYGVISDPNEVEKTAEEIRAGKQRFLVLISGLQRTLEESYKKLIVSMDIIATIYNLAPQGIYDTSFTWGDSIMEDPDKEYTRRMSMVSAGLLKPEQFVAWYFGIEYKEDDEETNRLLAALMPDMSDEPEGEIVE